MYAATSLRSLRLGYGLRLSEAAERAGISLSAASYAERDPAAHPENAEALRSAVDALAYERGLVAEATADDRDAELLETKLVGALNALDGGAV